MSVLVILITLSLGISVLPGLEQAKQCSRNKQNNVEGTGKTMY
jgi:hypothetical protein